MAEYISKEAVLKHLNECKEDPLFDPDMARICFAISIFIEKMQAADVQPVNHGRWIHIRGCWWQCSNCENNLIYTMSDRGRTEKHRYCSKCGARMDGEQNDF